MPATAPGTGGANVTPQVIYNELLSRGASTVQAIGIMANMRNESDFDPEAKGDYAGDTPTSFGLVQEHGSQYSSLVTGDPVADMRAQIRLLAQQGGFRAASGSTGAEAAGNFAANYEKCVGCQPGGDQNSQRQANAALIGGWVNSGKWPTSAGSSGGGGGSGQAAASSATCLISFPSAHILFFTLGGGCLLTKSAARAFIGAVLLGVAVPLGLGGVLVVAAGMGLRSGSGQQLLQSVPGAGPVAKVASRRSKTRAAGKRKEQAAGAREEKELEAKGATEIRRGRPRPRQDIPRSRTKNRPGRKTGTIPGPRDQPSEDKPPF